MRILLFGDYSGAHFFLKNALIKKGHEVVLINDGDGFKKFSSDINIRFKFFNFFFSILYIIYFLLAAKKFDIVQLIGVYKFNNKLYPRNLILKLLRLKSKKLVIYLCSSDAVYINSSVKCFKYSPVEDFLKIDLKNENYFLNTDKELHYNKNFLKKIDTLITSSYDYYVPYKYEGIDTKIIKLPIKYDLNIPKKKNKNTIKILYGISRDGFKGSKYILPALKRINKKFKMVNLKIIKNLTFEAYYEELKNCDLLIDQCNSQYCGINALIGLNLNKVVFSGAEKKALKFMNIDDCPIINITPNSNEIFNSIERVINNYDSIISNYNSNLYIKKFHNADLIASKFESIYKN